MSSRGFTLIELLITVVIMGVLAMVSVPTVQIVVQRTKEHELRAALAEIRHGIDAYHLAVEQGRIEKTADASDYPPSLEVLVEGVPNVQDPNRRLIYFLRRLPHDPFSPASEAAATTWGQRSYVSPPDAPEVGDDVFDVYSQSSRVGLNGIPYREW